MTPRQIIEQKQAGQELSQREIEYFIGGYTQGTIPDYQAAALLMAIYFQGMTTEETVCLTRTMMHSGRVIDFNGIPGKRVDKHSTGGVGDKISLTLAPTVATCGGQVPMISGRGLGHTGGTLDKLESIPGFDVFLDIEAIREETLTIGAAFAGQTDNLVPADKKIYSLRDVTGTVKSLPLITASILSKKAAEGINALVLDVKYGEGAIFPEADKMEELAQWLVNTGSSFGIETVALMTDMSQPLGRTVGNWLEMKECIEIMQSGEGAEDIIDLNNALAGVMLKLSGLADTVSAGMDRASTALKDGTALAKFRQIVEAQRGDLTVVDNPETYPPAKFTKVIKSPRNDYISEIHSRRVGELALLLGAGRKSKDDTIDYSAGVEFLKKRGDYVKKGETISVLYSDSEAKLSEVYAEFPEVFSFSQDRPDETPLIRKVITAESEYDWGDYLRSF